MKSVSITLIIFSISILTLKADCTITGPVAASSAPFVGCSGTITVNGDFTIDTDYNLTGLGDIQLIINDGMMSYSGNHNLTMSPGSSLSLSGTGQLETVNPCNSNKSISIGTTKIASCSGGGATYSFTDINNTGGINASGLLPVEFKNFEVIAVEGGLRLNWGTSMERNNDYFLVERSENGIEFTALDKIAGQGDTNEISQYSFIDYNIASQNYYRIKQVDYDGQFSYSQVVFKEAEKSETDITIYPNPVSGNTFQVAYLSKHTDRVKLTIYNRTGQIVQEKEYDIVVGGNNLSVLTETTPKGQYFIRISSEHVNYTGKLILIN